MHTTRLKFKYALRSCKRNESQHRADALAKDLSYKEFNGFWRKVSYMNNCKIGLPETIGEACGEEQIAKAWQQHYSSLLNESKDTLLDITHDSKCVSGYDSLVITAQEVEREIRSLKSGKAGGMDGVTAEHMKYAGKRLTVTLAICLTMMMSHGYVPENFMKTIIVPLVKNKAGDTQDKNNYRPIALAACVSKVMEKIILHKCKDELQTCNNQFGFKGNHSTDMCIFTLKQFLHKYSERGSPMFVCFLDASKAYDRVKHVQLFRILLQRGIPGYIIRLLGYWYQSQKMCVQWGRVFSKFFPVSNGVRQGGVLSPALFNVYIDEISKKLNEITNVGCTSGDIVVNNLLYADDMCLMAPSAKGLQMLIDVCVKQANLLDLKYNTKKTFCMCIQPKSWKLQNLPSLYLNSQRIVYVESYKYLGCYISNSLRDDGDVQRQIRAMYSRANCLVRKFGICSRDVKVQLFKAYLGNSYCSQLWSNVSAVQMQKVKVAYNNCLRIFFGLPRMCSISRMFVEFGIPSFGEFTRRDIFSFWTRIESSHNVIIHSIAGNRFKMMELFTYERWQRALFQPSAICP